MSLFVASLNSGSNGNCYYVGNDVEAIIIDAGLSCKEFEKRMFRLGLSMNKVRAIVISHEHTDHIFGLQAISRKYQVPVYITDATMSNGGVSIQPHLLKTFSAHVELSFGGISVLAFPKNHDASDPHSFIVRSPSVTVGVFTDIGRVCASLIDHFKLCHAAFLETNYDHEMLMTGKYPHHLKSRIKGGRGHLSNKQALELFLEHRPSFMSHLFLSHLSKENNDPDLVQELFMKYADGVKMVVASRYQETSVFKIESYLPAPFVAPRLRRNPQLTLF